MSESLRIVTSGQLVAGYDRLVVESNLAQLCKFSPDRVARVFSGEPFVFKSGLSSEQAQRYLTALTRAGIVVTAEPEQTSPGQPITQPTPTVTAPVPPRSAEQMTCPYCGSSQPKNPVCSTCEILIEDQIPAGDEQAWATFEQEEKTGFRYTNLLIMVLLAALLAGGIVYGGQRLWDYTKPKIQQMMTQIQPDTIPFEAVPPPANPPIQALKHRLSAAEMRQIYTLFENRNFALLNFKLETIQQQFEQDPTYEVKVIQAFSLFSETYAPYQALFDDWIAQYPDHFAPYLARGKYYTGIGWAKRGGKWAKNTSEDQFAGMHESFALALDDFASAFELNPHLLPAYTSLLSIYKAQGPRTALDATISEAQQLFPSSYQLYKEILKTKLPRWGGSYGIMNRFAHQANEQLALNPEMPFLYGKPYIDQAWYAKKEKNYQQEVELLTRALSYGEYAGLLEDRAQAYERLNDTASAIRDYSRAVEIYPEISSPYRHRATLYFKQGDYDRALADIRSAQDNMTLRNKDILAWYSWAIKNLIRTQDDHIAAYVEQSNDYEQSVTAQTYPAGRPLSRLTIENRFKAPPTTQPYGLAWHQGSLYMSSYMQAQGIYRINPQDGSVIKVGLPDIVYKAQYGGLTTDGAQLYHSQGHYSTKYHKLDPGTLESTGDVFLYSSQFHMGDLAYHNEHVYTVAYHLAEDVTDYRLLKFSADGKLRQSVIIQPIEGQSGSPGIASDGTWLWVSMGEGLYKIAPETGDIVDGFAFPIAVYGLAWDGTQLWGANAAGDIFTVSM